MSAEKHGRLVQAAKKAIEALSEDQTVSEWILFRDLKDVAAHAHDLTCAHRANLQWKTKTPASVREKVMEL